jgi:hypothetical protein
MRGVVGVSQPLTWFPGDLPLQVGFELQPSHPCRYTYLSLPVYDMVEQDIIGCFPAAFEFIDKAIASGAEQQQQQWKA